MRQNLKKPVCSRCGSDDVGLDATASWSLETQSWDLCGTYDEGFCRTCDAEGSSVIKWVDHHPDAPVHRFVELENRATADRQFEACKLILQARAAPKTLAGIPDVDLANAIHDAALATLRDLALIAKEPDTIQWFLEHGVILPS